MGFKAFVWAPKASSPQRIQVIRRPQHFLGFSNVIAIGFFAVLQL